MHTIKPTNAVMLKLYFADTTCHNSDMFRPIVIFFRELLDIYKAYKYIDGLLNTSTLKFVHKIFIGFINLSVVVKNWSISCEVVVYNGSHQVDVKFVLW